MDNKAPKWFRLLLNGKLNLLSNENGFRLWSFPVYSARESNKGFCWVLQEKKVGGWGAVEYRDMVYAENVFRTLHLCLILYTIFANWQLQIPLISGFPNDQMTVYFISMVVQRKV